MKKLLILFAVLSFCLSTVSALQVSVGTLGGPQDKVGANVSTTLTITNDGSNIVTNLSISHTADSKYSVSFSSLPSSIAPGSSAVVTVNGRIPSSFSGKQNIGALTVNGKLVSTAMSPQNQSPDEFVVPVAMSATSTCGETNTQDPGSPIIGQWHSGTCNWVPDVEVMSPFNGSVDAGWARVHSDNFMDYWVNTVAAECGGSAQTPPSNWTFGGKIHTGPGLCDGKIESAGADSGWVGFYSNPNADGKLILIIAEDKCGGSPQQVPADGVVLGRVRTGPNQCDGGAEAVSYTGTSIDAGSMYVVWVPVEQTPENNEPVGEFESLNSTGLSGWAFDADAPSITVDVFVDSQFWKSLDANVQRDDLVASGKTPDANHGFSYTFTDADKSQLNFALNHTFHVYAINSPEGQSVLLNGSPKVLLASMNGSNGGNNTGGGSNTSPTDVSASTSLFMEAQRGLVINRVKLNCDKQETVDDGETIKDITPGRTCFLTIKVENEGGVDLEDIEVEAETDSSDVDGDSDDISSLDEGDSEEVVLELEIDEDADGKVKITITAVGEDENGNTYSDEFVFFIDVEKPKHDVRVTSVRVSPSQADGCLSSRVTVTVTVENKGQRDEDEVVVGLSVPGLTFNEKQDEVEIEEDDSQTFTFSVPLPEGKSGSFTATATAFYDNVVKSGDKTANIVVAKCDDDVIYNDPVPKDDVVVIQPPKEEEPVKNGNGAVLLGVLIFANLIGLTVLGVMLYHYFKGKQNTEFQYEDDKSEVNSPKDYY